MAFAARGRSGSPGRAGSSGRAGSPGRSGSPGRAGEPATSAGSLAPPDDPAQVARQICLHQLEFAPRTRAELAATLAKRGVAADVADDVLGRFAEVGMIDDALFAQMWVSSRHRGRGLAGRALQQELRRKGVDDATARAALNSLDSDQERATARALVERRLAATRGLTPDARVRRLAGLLARKGYPSGVAFAVVREALADEGVAVEMEFDALQALED